VLLAPAGLKTVERARTAAYLVAQAMPGSCAEG
jgi:hypothetical protein